MQMFKYKKIIVGALGLRCFSAMAQWSINVGPITVAPEESSGNLNVVEQVAQLPDGFWLPLHIEKEVVPQRIDRESHRRIKLDGRDTH